MKLSAEQLKNLKNVRHINMMTCYDHQMAYWLNQTNLDAILIGDTVGEIIYGFKNSTFVTMDIMLRHTEAVASGAPDIHIIGDMPYRSYETSALAIKNARAFLAAGADSVKLENPPATILQKLHEAQIPVCGHVGLTPQTIHDYKKQGTNASSAQKILEESQTMNDSHCYALIIEAVPQTLAEQITKTLTIPTIGIASGKSCDGQIRVLYDLIGITKNQPSFATPLAQLGKNLQKAIQDYINKP